MGLNAWSSPVLPTFAPPTYFENASRCYAIVGINEAETY